MVLNKKSIKKITIYIILVITSFLFILPFYWMVATSLKPIDKIFVSPPQWFPYPIIISNYKKALFDFDYFLYLKNSIIVTGISILGALLVNPIIAFSFSILNWKYREFFFLLVLSTIMLPIQVRLIPLYEVFRNLGWLNTYMPLVIIPWFGHPIFIFLLRQFMKNISRELIEAARIDGCNNYGIYWKIVLPQVKSALAAVAIFQFMWKWNQFLQPLIYINDTAHKTLPLGLMDYLAQASLGGFLDWGALMAAALLSLIPCLIVFIIAQEYLIEGLTYTSK